MKPSKSILQHENLTVGLTFLFLNLIYGWSFWFLGFIGLVFILQHFNDTKASKEES